MNLYPTNTSTFSWNTKWKLRTEKCINFQNSYA